MNEFMVVWVTNDVEKYPERRADSEMFPQCVQDVEDEVAGFVVDQETGDHYPVEEFFLMEKVRRFSVLEMSP